MKLDLSGLGIIEGDRKRFLPNYIDERIFKQRKSYDEYYVSPYFIDVNMDIEILMILAEQFIVTVEPDCVALSIQ